MKKFFVTILAFLYLGASSGAMVTMHYCMGELANTEWGQTKATSCKKCGMDKTRPGSAGAKKGCCEDQFKFVKDNSDQKTATAGFQFVFHLTIDLPAQTDFTGAVLFTPVTEGNPVSNSPPSGESPPLYLRNCVFLI